MKYIFIVMLVGVFGCSSTKTSSGSDEGLKESYKIISLNKMEKLTANPTLNFDLQLGSVSGNGGCNNYGGKVRVNGEKISFDNVMSTEMACDFLNIEHVFFQHLSAVKKYSVVDDELFLYDENNQLLISCKSNEE